MAPYFWSGNPSGGDLISPTNSLEDDIKMDLERERNEFV
jgi:hypothetical protein